MEESETKIEREWELWIWKEETKYIKKENVNEQTNL